MIIEYIETDIVARQVSYCPRIAPQGSVDFEESACLPHFDSIKTISRQPLH